MTDRIECGPLQIKIHLHLSSTRWNRCAGASWSPIATETRRPNSAKNSSPTLLIGPNVYGDKVVHCGKVCIFRDCFMREPVQVHCLELLKLCKYMMQRMYGCW